MRVWEVHVSYKSSGPILPPLSWWITSSCVEGEGKTAEERYSYLICEWERCLRSISWRKCLSESQDVGWSSGTTQEWLTAAGASCLGMSSVVALHSRKTFTPNFLNLGSPQTFYLHVQYPAPDSDLTSVIHTYTDETEEVLLPRWETGEGKW